MSTRWVDAQEAYRQAASWFVSTCARAGDRWEAPALGEWTVRDLVGHTSRALLTVEAYLDQPAADIQVTSPVDYFRLALAPPGGHAGVARRGRDAGIALGAEPARAVADTAARVVARVDAATGDEPVATPVGGMRLGDYLPTRTFELTVHTCDLTAALGVAAGVPEAAALESLTLLGGLATRAGLAGPLLLAATGRTGLPADFTVL